MRLPLLNASLPDAVFELERSATGEALKAAFEATAPGALAAILDYEIRLLVSVDTATIPAAPAWMAAQAIRGIAKELNQMGANSAITTVVPETPVQLRGAQQLIPMVDHLHRLHQCPLGRWLWHVRFDSSLSGSGLH